MAIFSLPWNQFFNRYFNALGLSKYHSNQTPVIEHNQSFAIAKKVQTGTSVTIFLPDSASLFLSAAKVEFVQFVQNFSFLNPHLSLSLNWFGDEYFMPATDPHWKKWKPSNPTSPHWYELDHFERLISAYLAHDKATGRIRSIREFVAEFSGLTTSAKCKKVTNDAELTRQPLSVLIKDCGSELDHAKTLSLLRSMQNHSKAVPAKNLGILGRDHVFRWFATFGYDMDSFTYKRIIDVHNNVPCVLEAAFAWMGEENDQCCRNLISGINWSPGINNPFRYLESEPGLESLLESLFVSRQDPVCFMLHMASPRVSYADRGKSSVIFDGESLIPLAIEDVTINSTKKWTKQRNAEIKSELARMKRRERVSKPRDDTRSLQKEAAFSVMEKAYMKASANNTLPAAARQIMYAARGDIQEMTGKALDDKYFTQDLLIQYLKEYPEKDQEWNVVFDPRGTLHEPYTGISVPLGTLQVRDYLSKIKGFNSRPFATPKLDNDYYPSCGPTNRYGAIMFVEKEGFMPLFNEVGLAERYDLAIMSTKGLSVVAARMLIDELCKDRGDIKLLIVRDFDKAGFSIAGTLRETTYRYTFNNNVNAIDFGLRLDDVCEMGLEHEDVSYGKTDPTSNLRKNGATNDEIDFLYSRCRNDIYTGQRVELNAMTSDQLIGWLEGKLKANGIEKIIPAQNDLEEAYKRMLARKHFQHTIDKAAGDVKKIVDEAEIPGNLAEKIRAEFKADPLSSWDEILPGLL